MLDLYLLSLVIEFVRFFFNDNFNVSNVCTEKDVEVSLWCKCDLISIFIKVAEIKFRWERLKDLRNTCLEFLKSFNVGGFQYMYLFVETNFEKHKVIIIKY